MLRVTASVWLISADAERHMSDRNFRSMWEGKVEGVRGRDIDASVCLRGLTSGHRSGAKGTVGQWMFVVGMEIVLVRAR